MKRFDQINMVPFIDVMLVLLAIVLTTATFVSQGLIEVNLPTAEQVSEPDEDLVPLEIAIDDENKLYFDGDAVSLEAMGEKLDAIKPEQLLVLRIDQDARFQNFISLVDLLKTKGLNNLSIQAQKDSAGQEETNTSEGQSPTVDSATQGEAVESSAAKTQEAK